MALYVNLLIVTLLALVAGLLLALHQQMKDWRATSKQAPLLAEKLTEALMSARGGLADLKKELATLAPDLNRLVEEGGKARTELQFLLQRAEKTGARLAGEREVVEGRDEDDEMLPQARLAPDALAAVERVAGANGLAARNDTPRELVRVGGDPLEELLANLQGGDMQGSDGPVVSKHPADTKRKRSGPVTQAELDLQQHLKGAA